MNRSKSAPGFPSLVIMGRHTVAAPGPPPHSGGFPELTFDLAIEARVSKRLLTANTVRR